MFFLIFISSCSSNSSYKQTKLGNSKYNAGFTSVLLIPLQDFSSATLDSIAINIEEQHYIKVSSYTAMGTDETMYNDQKEQYITENLMLNAAKIMHNNGLQACQKTVLILTNKDINTSSFRLRYVFSSHAHAVCISVISTARINPINYNSSKNDDLTKSRLNKLINKALGYHLYKLEASSNINSVMYGPILSPMDLDKVGDWYN